jgi:hypothetical protein
MPKHTCREKCRGGRQDLVPIEHSEIIDRPENDGRGNDKVRRRTASSEDQICEIFNR